MDISTLLESGVIAAVVSGLWNYIDNRQRSVREDSAVKRQIRAAAHALGIRVILARQFGFTNTDDLMSALAYLRELIKDRTIEVALTDKASKAIHDIVDLCDVFVRFSRSQGIDPETTLRNLTPDDREKRQLLFSNAAKPTFDKMREYFEEDGSREIVAEFDKASAERTRLERIRAGLE